jgi:L-lactate dehydrogenase complex protein LldG
MNSREKILAEIKKNKPAEVSIPQTDFDYLEEQDKIALYIDTLTGIGGKVAVVDSLEIVQEFYLEKKSAGLEVVNGFKDLDGYNIEDYRTKNATEVEGVDTLFLKGTLAVAENAAVWLYERDMVNRLLPFICQHLVFIVDEKDVVSNMHEAYKRIKVDEDGYGVFIAGPSKTADIEQSLVIGAHGPLSLNVFIIKNGSQLA